MICNDSSHGGSFTAQVGDIIKTFHFNPLNMWTQTKTGVISKFEDCNLCDGCRKCWKHIGKQQVATSGLGTSRIGRHSYNWLSFLLPSPSDITFCKDNTAIFLRLLGIGIPTFHQFASHRIHKDYFRVGELD